jgi:flagellar biosynthesis protein FlhA
MPGKQMAIDADLNAGQIGEADAKRRRAEVAQEADFYGSMDGASKFVRGDAIAGLLIMVINIVGGLVVGMAQHGLDFGTAAQTYTLLAVGDGLVAQIPALVISTAAGVMVSRVTTDEDVGRQLTSQLFSNRQVLFITAAIIGLLGVIPGMPHLPFLLIAGSLVFLGRRTAPAEAGRQQSGAGGAAQAPAAPAATESTDVTWDDVSMVDPLGMEVGYKLIPMVDGRMQGEVLGRIKAIRKKLAGEVGFLVPVVHIRDNLELKPTAYVLTLKGVPVARGEAEPKRWLAINPGDASGKLAGTETREPAFGMPAVWIDANQCKQAQMLGYTVVDAPTAIATHLNQVIQTHLAELLGLQEVQQLLEQLAKTAPKLTEDLVPKVIGLTTLQKILQNLLAEGIAIRDMRTILEVLIDRAPAEKDPMELTSAVRLALGRAITQQIFGDASELQVIGLHPELDRVLAHALATNSGIEPGLAQTILDQAAAAMQRTQQLELPAVLVVPPPLRVLMARFLRRSLPQLTVLSTAEIPDSRTLRVIETIGGSV